MSYGAIVTQFCQNCYALSTKHMKHRNHIVRNISYLLSQLKSQKSSGPVTCNNSFSISSNDGGKSSYSSDKTTHFGYQTVSEKEKRENGK